MTVNINVKSLISNYYPGNDYAIDYYLMTKELINKDPSIRLNEITKKINTNKALKLPRTQIKTITKYANSHRPKNLQCLDEFIRRFTNNNFHETQLTDEELRTIIEKGHITLEGNLFEYIYETAIKNKTFGTTNKITLTMNPNYLSTTFDLIKNNYQLDDSSIQLTAKKIIINDYLLAKALYTYHQQLIKQ